MALSFDIVILGGGPAGSAAAKTAVDLGLSVALIDKAAFPRDKLCGGLLSGRSIRALEALFDGSRPVPKPLISGLVQFKWEGETLAEFDAPHDLTLTMRYDFDAELQRLAQDRGVQMFYGARQIAVDPRSNRLSFDGQTIGYKILIGADGVNSQVARTLFGKAFSAKSVGFGLEAEIPSDALAEPPHIQIDFRAVKWGYGWVFPKAGGWTIGVGGLLAKNPDMKAQMRAYLTALGVAPEAAKIKGHHLPFGEFRKIPGRRNIMLAGDAAGLVDPLTGEGIAYALESGALAARAAKQALDIGAPDRAIQIYRQSLAPHFAELSNAVFLRRFAFLSKLEPLFRDRLTHSERLRTAFFDLLDGRETYASLRQNIGSTTFKALKKRMFFR